VAGRIEESLDSTAIIAQPETASQVLAAQAVAKAQARFLVALKNPRDWDVVRQKLLKDCERPAFAAVARYSKPIGSSRVTGLSVDFARAAQRHMTNIDNLTFVVYDDADKRIVRNEVTDLEANVTVSKDVHFEKTVERKSGGSRCRGLLAFRNRAECLLDERSRQRLLSALDLYHRSRQLRYVSKLRREEGRLMSDAPGTFERVGVTLSLAALSSNVEASADAWLASHLTLPLLSLAGIEQQATRAVASFAEAGAVTPTFGSEFFEKIIVSPRRFDAGLILKQVQFPVNVWSTFRAQAQTLDAITTDGPGAIVITTSAGSAPWLFLPGRSLDFLLTILSEGAVTIDERIIFEFAGLDTGATDLVVTGTRLAVFAFDHDWNEQPRERMVYVTWVFRAHDGSEQRAQLRKTPRPLLTFRVQTMSPEETALLEALVYGWQNGVFGVPMWTDVQLLASAAHAGDTALAFDPTLRAFAPGGLGLLRRDARTFEAFNIVSVSSAGLVLASPLSGDWPVQSEVVPLVRGRLAAQLDINRDGELADADVIFACEVV
jgi:hypothetical protein